MDQTAKTLSRTLDGLSRALAEWTVTRHAEQDVNLPNRYGTNWREDWVASVYARLEYLSQSVAVRRPALFAGMISWEAAGYLARGSSLEDLRLSLECLQGVLRSELVQAAEVVEPHLTAGLAALAAQASPPATAVNGPLTAVTLGYLEAILDSHSEEALRLILRQARNGTSIRDLYLQVLRPAMAEIGHMWHRGEITVADEHMATATTQVALSTLRFHFPRNIPHNGKRVVVAALGGDYHEIGLRMAAGLLEMDGWEVAFIGSNTPGAEIMDYVQREPSHLLTLGIGSCLRFRAAGELIDCMAAQLGEAHPRVLLGGAPLQIVHDVWKELGADACAHDLESVPSIARLLVGDVSV